MADDYTLALTGAQADDRLSADYIVEQGQGAPYSASNGYTLESGRWYYRKWNSGIMEAWTTAQFTNVVPDISWASGIYKKLLCAPLTFPVAFSVAPVVTMTANVYGAWGWPIADTSRSYTRPSDVFIFCPATPSTALTVYLNFHAIGRWRN